MIKGTLPPYLKSGGRKMVEPTSEQLHWNQLRKQALLDEKVPDYCEVAKSQLGLHSTDYWTPYFSVWSRIGDFDAKDMYESLDSGRNLVRTHAFRTTIHVMHIDNLSMIINATGPSLFKACRTDKYRKVDVLTDKEIESMLSDVRDALREGPLGTSDLKKVVPEIGDHVRSALLMLMAHGEVVRAKAKHARSNLTSYALLSQWVDGFKLKIVDEQDAITTLIQHHIERFGPVTIDDIAWWLRLTKTVVKSAITSLGEEIVTLNFGNSQMYMGSSDFEITSSIEKPKDNLVWFLPYEDHFLKAFIDRSNFIDESIQPMVFPADRRHFWPSNPDVPQIMPSKGSRATGEVRPTIWLDGRVVGRWELDDDEKQKKVVTSIYAKDAMRHLNEIEDVRIDLEDFVNHRLLPISK
ncbi:winged helix DNA-binding domain-containing protein [Candidatus Thorarchaeota archaeon]|nr:MAG: winged helix DNA-binding domain-containing protein [Candidatus Thorarchaeota archaeon]